MKKSILYAAAATAACVTLVGVPMIVSAQNAQPAAGANAAAKQVARKKVFQIHVILDQTFSVQGGKGSATMILFHGDLDTTFFKGEIQPGAVDTQRSGAISARYILQGTDADGTPTKIFIDNSQVNGVLKPYVLTDNPKLRWLENTDWEARIAMGGFGGFGGMGGMPPMGGGAPGGMGGMPPMGGFGGGMGGFPGFGGGAPGGPGAAPRVMLPQAACPRWAASAAAWAASPALAAAPPAALLLRTRLPRPRPVLLPVRLPRAMLPQAALLPVSAASAAAWAASAAACPRWAAAWAASPALAAALLPVLPVRLLPAMLPRRAALLLPAATVPRAATVLPAAWAVAA